MFTKFGAREAAVGLVLVSSPFFGAVAQSEPPQILGPWTCEGGVETCGIATSGACIYAERGPLISTYNVAGGANRCWELAKGVWNLERAGKACGQRLDNYKPCRKMIGVICTIAPGNSPYMSIMTEHAQYDNNTGQAAGLVLSFRNNNYDGDITVKNVTAGVVQHLQPNYKNVKGDPTKTCVLPPQ